MVDEVTRLRNALINVMGYLDTPIARRKLGIDPNTEEWLIEARELIKVEPIPEQTMVFQHQEPYLSSDNQMEALEAIRKKYNASAQS